MAVIHDLNFEAHPEFLPGHIGRYYRYFFPKFARKASRIATVSEFTKRDISKRYGISNDKIDVVYNGANKAFRPLHSSEVQEVREMFSDGKPYFLFVGLIHPRKNLENQLKAFEIFKRETGSEMKFVVVGARHWWSNELEALATESAFKEDIKFLGRKSLDDLIGLYGAAFALMYVSFFEGFGIPITEAFQAEIPVITSSESSMPEICGDAGIVVDPNSVKEISDAMITLSNDPELRKKLIEEGIKRRSFFSWDKTAELLWESILKAAE